MSPGLMMDVGARRQRWRAPEKGGELPWERGVNSGGRKFPSRSQRPGVPRGPVPVLLTGACRSASGPQFPFP